MRVLGDAAQRGQVAVILRVVDRGGQLVLIKDLSLYPQRVPLSSPAACILGGAVAAVRLGVRKLGCFGKNGRSKASHR